MTDTQMFNQARIELGYSKTEMTTTTLRAIAERAQAIKQAFRLDVQRRQARLQQAAFRQTFAR